MDIISIIVTLIVVGVILWGLQQILSVIPMDERIKKVINVLVIVLVCLWILSLFVPLGHIGAIRIER